MGGDSFKRVGVIFLGVGALILGLYLQKKLNWADNFTAIMQNPGFCSSDAVNWRRQAAGNDIASYFYTLGVVFTEYLKIVERLTITSDMENIVIKKLNLLKNSSQNML